MTDQDPTQAYPPAAPAPQRAGGSVPAAPPAADVAAPAAPPAPPPPAGAPVYAPAGADPAAQVDAAAAAPASPRKTGRSPVKWIVAALVVLLVAGLAAGAAVVLTAGAGDPAVLAWTPADSVAYAELRLDLPGSQSAELAKVMKAFPGFEDQAAFPVKFSEILDQVAGKVSSGTQSYQTDIKPWFGGQIGASIGPIPTTADPAAARALLLLSTTDGAKASAWAAGIAQDAGATTSTEPYNGTTITLVTPKDGAPDEMQAAYAVEGSVLAIGDPASVKASIDTQGKTGLNTVPQFKEAAASISGDRLGFAYVDLAAIVAGAQSLAGAAGDMQGLAQPIGELPAMLGDAVAPWAVVALRAQDGALIVDTRSPHTAASGPVSNAESKLPGLVPATTVFLAEGHDVGKVLARTKDALAAQPSLKDAVKQVDDILGILGGFEAVSGWINEAGVAITRDGDSVSGGLVMTPTDAAAAERLFNQLTGFIQLGGAAAGLSATTEDHNGVTITVLNLGGLGGMIGGATGGAAQVPADASLAFAVTDDVVVIGYGAEFVKGVLDAKDGESLADTERFSTAIKQAGAVNSALLWVDVVGLRGLAESMVPDANRAGYDADLKPYLAGFDTVTGTMVPGESIDAGTLIVRVIGS